jgi:hypothetical protein
MIDGMENGSPAGHGPCAGQTLADVADAVEAMPAEAAVADPVMTLSAAARLDRASRSLAEHAAAAAIAAGMSWTDVGAAYGVSKQAAHQRFARHVRRAGRDHA